MAPDEEADESGKPSTQFTLFVSTDSQFAVVGVATFHDLGENSKYLQLDASVSPQVNVEVDT